MFLGTVTEKGLISHYTAVRQRLGISGRRHIRTTKIAGVNYEYRSANHREREFLVIARTRPPVPSRLMDADTPDFAPRWQQICSEVAAKAGMTEAAILSFSRKRPVILVKQEAMYRMYHETTLSMEQIAAHFGYRDHTIVGHSIRKHADRLKREEVE